MKLFWALVFAWFTPPPSLRRYRVAPRLKPSFVRHNLLRGIQLELRRSDLLISPRNPGRTTL